MIMLSQMTDSYITIEFAKDITIEALDTIVRFEQALMNSDKIRNNLREIVPAYTTITVYYQPQDIATFEKVKRQCDKLVALFNKDIINDTAKITKPTKHTNNIEIPVFYGGEYGQDLQFVAEHCNMTVEQVIKLHSSKTYTVGMTGFLPGFVYLLGLAEELYAPRRDSPRSKVKAGSIAIAGQQTGIYGIDSPGGWQIIGRTDFKLIDWHAEQPFFIQAGDKVKFTARS